MKKRGILLLVIAIIVLVCIVTLVFLYTNCSFSIGFTNKQACLVDKAVKSGNVGICEKSESPMWCYQDVAKELMDEDICKRIDDEKFSGNCITQIAVLKKDPNICLKINGSMEYGCLIEVNK